MLDALGKEQHNKTDKDATVMSKPTHNLMAYNSQIAVDDIETIVPPRATAKTKKIQNAKFSKNQFIYNPEEDCYICPNNQIIKNSKR